MTANDRNSDDILRAIDDLSVGAPHTDDESRAALRESGIDPDAFSRGVLARIHSELPRRERHSVWDIARTCALGLTAAAAVVFVVVFHINSRASTEAQHQLTRAQLIGPLLPGLASGDPEKRSIALVVARQVDPSFAAETSKQLALWEVRTQAEARAHRNVAYASKILAGVQKLELSRDPDDRKMAIWNDLLPVLLESRKNRDDFVDVAIEYQRVLPLLRVRNPERFLDSYWGELWILNILLDSKIVPVVDAARQQAPEPSVVQHIYQQNAPSLPDRDRKAFEEAVAVYVSTLQALR